MLVKGAIGVLERDARGGFKDWGVFALRTQSFYVMANLWYKDCLS